MSKKKDKKAKDEVEEGAEAETKPEGEGAEGEEGEGAPKKGKKKLIIIVAAVLLLVIIGVAVMLLTGGKKKAEGGHGEEAAHGEAAAHGEEPKLDEHGKPIPPAGPTYYELPQFLVNLNSPNGRVSFLKMSVTLQLKNAEAVVTMDANKPRVMDAFNTYLRELRPADVQGSAGIYRLRGELMTRLNATVEEGLVKDILFSEIIVQ